jgi:hypothetical protein
VPASRECLVTDRTGQCAGKTSIDNFGHRIQPFQWSYPQIVTHVTYYKILDLRVVVVAKRAFAVLAAYMHNKLTTQA